MPRSPTPDPHDPLVRLLQERRNKKRKLPPHLRHLEHLTQQDWEESVRGQNALIPGGGTPWLLRRTNAVHEEILAPWLVRGKHTISEFLQGRGFPSVLHAVREAEFLRRLEDSPHVRELIGRLGADAHFSIAGLWWLLKETTSPQAILAARGELRPPKERVRRYRERQRGQGELPPAEPGILRILFNPPPPNERGAGRPRIQRDPSLWPLRVFQALTRDHFAKVTGGRFRSWRLIGALSAEFVALQRKDQSPEAVRREVHRIRKEISGDIGRIRERIRWIVWDALRGPHLWVRSNNTDRPIPWEQLRRQWSRMLTFTPVTQSGKPVVVQIRDPSPLTPGQSIGEWFDAERKAGKVTILNLPRLPRLIG